MASTLSILESDAGAAIKTELASFGRAVQSGTDIARAGQDSGLFLPWEARLLGAAQVSGQLDETYTALGRRYRQRASWSRRLRSHMLLPLLLFIPVIFIAPFPALYRGDISGLGYLVSTLGRLFLLMGGLFLLSFGWRRLAAYGTESALARAILHVPVLGGLIRRQQRFDFLYNLSLLLAAGLPAFDALETAAQGVSHPSLRRQFKVAASFCRDGQDVVSSLERCGAFEDADAAALGRSGEFSGQLDQMIRHHVDQLGERLDRQYTLLGEWLPRVFYLLLLLYLVMA